MQKASIFDEFKSYIQLTDYYQQPTTPKLIIMHGVSASGKSTVSQQIVDKLGLIRIRSDVERKRLFTNSKTDSTPITINSGLYSEKVSEQTYAKLLELTSQIIEAGYGVIVDAAFLQKNQREPFQMLAKSLSIPYLIVQTTAPADILRQRIIARKNDVSDADLKVLEYQLSKLQSLLPDEIISTVSINNLDTKQIDKLIENII